MAEFATSSTFRISTSNLPCARRLPALCDLFDRSIGMEIRPARDQAVDLQIDTGPGLRRTLMRHPFTAQATRPPVRLADGNDTVCLLFKTAGHMTLSQGRHEVAPLLGDGVLMVYREPSQIRFREATYLAVRVPFQALAMLADVEAAAARCIPAHTAALRLLRSYIVSLPERLADPLLGKLVATHVYDLMALAIGATREGRECAHERGVRAARLEAIKADLTRDAELSIDEIAHRQGVTPRYVQMLFEEQGTTFGEFATDRRLDNARAMLCSPRYAAWSIAGIAFEAGFLDLSHFNRRFRRRFGATPSELRRQG
jgi:AraC-like DNA-binding protein